MMDITVLISTWNNADRLRITLQALCACTTPENLSWQITLVNNNCTDHTDQVAASFQDLLPINYVHEPRQGLSRARNRGLEASRGEWVIFTDDDVRPCSDWISIYWRAFKAHPKHSFFGGPIVSEFEGEPPELSLLEVAPCSVRGQDFGPSKRTLSPKEHFISANWAARLTDIRSVDGFDRNLGLNPDAKTLSTGEESDLMDRLRSSGLVAHYLPEATLEHFVPADKASLKHILERCEAGVVGKADLYDFRLKSWILLRKPLGLYCHAFFNYLKFVAAKLTFHKGRGEYVKYRMVLSIARQKALELAKEYGSSNNGESRQENRSF
jgi:glucosyl-dolichyl phosphate glucuronosyltransferase